MDFFELENTPDVGPVMVTEEKNTQNTDSGDKCAILTANKITYADNNGSDFPDTKNTAANHNCSGFPPTKITKKISNILKP